MLREGSLLAKVRHRNVVVVHGVERSGDFVGLWMEFISGRTMEDELRARGPLSAEEATPIGVDLCQALAAVHGRGLVHRDVKAQNVMREEGGRTVLMDFGAGTELATGLRKPHDMAGTPLYLAPELFDGPASDAGLRYLQPRGSALSDGHAASTRSKAPTVRRSNARTATVESNGCATCGRISRASSSRPSSARSHPTPPHGRRQPVSSKPPSPGAARHRCRGRGPSAPRRPPR